MNLDVQMYESSRRKMLSEKLGSSGLRMTEDITYVNENCKRTETKISEYNQLFMSLIHKE